MLGWVSYPPGRSLMTTGVPTIFQFQQHYTISVKKELDPRTNQPPDFNYAKADWGHWESQRINLTCWYNNLINGLHTAYRRLARFIYHRLSRYNRSASCLLCCCHTRQFPIPGVLRISIPIETKQKILVFYEFLASI